MLGCSPAAEYFCCICEALWVQSSALAGKEGEGERARRGRKGEVRNMQSGGRKEEEMKEGEAKKAGREEGRKNVSFILINTWK